jgi:murein DD-endopeptidase MepM/ murein hydrolase activator NlpD
VDLRLESARGVPTYWGADLDVREKKFPSEKLKVEQNFVTPNPADEARADRELARLNALFSAPASGPLFEGNFVSPIPKAVSARFGERRVFNGVPRAPHTGADLRAAAGTPVHAPSGGRVLLAESLFFQGKTVLLDHGGGAFSYYCHLSKITVKPGERVKRGALLGLVGATGRVTGPHLHWAVRLRKARVDPYSLVAIDLNRWLAPRR